MDFIQLASDVGQRLIEKSLHIVTAESCTGGWLAQALTSVEGASAFFDCGFVTYSNESKVELLGVSEEILAKFGAVSEQTVKEMAQGALKYSRAQISLAITGLAGPGGGGETKPIGMVWFGLVGTTLPLQAHCQQFSGDREQIRSQAVEFALNMLLI
jgi:nicotinamide-nucleotide amidase